MYVFSHAGGCDHILVTLQNQGSGLEIRKIGSIIGKEGDTRKMLRKPRVRPAETGLQLGGKLRMLWVTHDDWCHRGRPAKMVAGQLFEQIVDVRALESAYVARIVDVAGRGTNHHHALEEFGPFYSSQGADHGTHGMAHKIDLFKAKSRDYLQNILRVPPEGAIARAVERG
jgi:hypothetical protein